MMNMDDIASLYNEVRMKFPGAVAVREMVDIADKHIRGMGYAPDRVTVGKATCRDDSIGQMHKAMDEYGFSPPFQMETLTAFPISGRTMITAYYHHIPENGLGLIIYAPHIGIDKKRNWGYVNRRGITSPGKCCGANHVLLNHFAKECISAHDDRELYDVAAQVNGSAKAVLSSKDPILALTNMVYEKGLPMLSGTTAEVQKEEHHKYPIILISGVHIDMPHSMYNLFHLRSIKLMENGRIKDIPLNVSNG